MSDYENGDYTKDYEKDKFLPGDDAPVFRAGDGTFIPHPDAPEFPKSDGLPAGENPETAPEFRVSDGVNQQEGPAETKVPVPYENTTDAPLYREEAVDGQTTKAEAAEDDDFNHTEDVPVMAERAKATDRAQTEDDAETVEADDDPLGEPLSDNAAAPGPEHAEEVAEAHKADDEDAADREDHVEQVADGTAVEDVDGENKIEAKLAEPDKTEEVDAEDVASESTVDADDVAKVNETLADAREDGFDAEAKEEKERDERDAHVEEAAGE